LSPGADPGAWSTFDDVLVRRACACLALLLGTGAEAFAQPTDQTAPAAQAAEPEPLIWHDTTFLFQQRVTTQTLGVGRDYQSADPYYDWSFYLRPRLYLIEREKYSLSLRAQGLVTHELTNSNTTTDRGELTLEDTIVSIGPQFTPYDYDEYATNVSLGLPRVVLPTSKASRGVGKIVEVGVRALVEQDFPLRRGEALFPRGNVGLRGGYGYTFTNSNVPENEDLDQLRVDMNGHTVSNDQLSGAALADHVGLVHGIVGADILRDRLAFSLEAGLDFAHKYALAEGSELMLDTGPVEVPADPNAPRLSVINYLDASVEFRVGQDLLSLILGYENITAQLAPDGQRRGLLWSPDAKFYLSVELRLDTLYTTVAAPSRKQTAGGTSAAALQ
jgi:hypothetical protein